MGSIWTLWVIKPYIEMELTYEYDGFGSQWYSFSLNKRVDSVFLPSCVRDSDTLDSTMGTTDAKNNDNSCSKGPQYQSIYMASVFGIVLMVCCICVIFGHLDPQGCSAKRQSALFGSWIAMLLTPAVYKTCSGPGC